MDSNQSRTIRKTTIRRGSMKAIDFIKYQILHLRPPLPEYEWGSTDEDTEDNEYDLKSLGYGAANQIRELNQLIILIKHKIKQNLPDYLSENLEDIQLKGTVNKPSLHFRFSNYNKMNRKLVNEIRCDFMEASQTMKLPDYKINFQDTNFTLIFYLEDYI